MPRFPERDEGEREPPFEKYPWDGVSGVRPFAELAAATTVGRVLTERFVFQTAGDRHAQSSPFRPAIRFYVLLSDFCLPEGGQAQSPKLISTRSNPE